MSKKKVISSVAPIATTITNPVDKPITFMDDYAIFASPADKLVFAHAAAQYKDFAPAETENIAKASESPGMVTEDKFFLSDLITKTDPLVSLYPPTCPPEPKTPKPSAKPTPLPALILDSAHETAASLWAAQLPGPQRFTPECTARFKSVARPIEPLPSTQKYLGVLLCRKFLQTSQLGTFGICAPVPYDRDPLLSEYGWPIALPNGQLPSRSFWLGNNRRWFARPAPKTPRHGFVDSCEVDWPSDAQELFVRARAADPEAELLVMPLLRGKYSGVCTNAGVTWGFNNDGVTNAAGGTIFIPAPSVHYKDHLQSFFDTDWTSHSDYCVHIEPDQEPYLELVEDFGIVRAVQVRAGPTLPITRDFIPHPITVSTIIDAHDWIEERCADDVDPECLLAWETACAQWGAEPGTIIYYEDAPLASHWAVHAIQNSIPFITSAKCPAVGDTLAPTTEPGTYTLTSTDTEQIASHMFRWFNDALVPHPHAVTSPLNMRLLNHLLLTAVGVTHAQALWPSTPTLNHLRAMAAVVLARILAMACFGELRHCYTKCESGFVNSKKGEDDDSHSDDDCLSDDLPDDADHPLDWALLGEPKHFYANNGYTPIRDWVYFRAVVTPWATVRTLLPSVYSAFARPGWSSSFGGANWAVSTRMVIEYARCVEAFHMNPTPANWTLVVAGMHRVVNAAHNGGKLAHKVMSASEFDSVAACPQLGFLNPVAACVALYETEWIKEILK